MPAYQLASWGTSAFGRVGTDCHERAAARGEEPLVGGGHDVGEARRVQRQPAGGLGGVQQHVGPVVVGGGGERVEVKDGTAARTAPR